MGFIKKLSLLLFIILGGIIFYFWGGNIFEGLKEGVEIVDLVVKKFLIIPIDEICLWLGSKISEPPRDILNNFLGFIFDLILFLFSFAIYICYLIIWFVIRIFLVILLPRLIIEIIDYCIEVFGGDCLVGKIFLSFICGICGGLFNYLILLIFCQVVRPIYALTIVDFFNLLKRGKKKELKLPIYLTLAILMFCWGSWRLMVAPFLSNLDEIKERLQYFKISTTTQWEDHESSFWELFKEGRTK